MLDPSPFLNLPLIWGGVLALAVFLYVLLDGFDLGCGILFPFAPSHECRSRMMNSIAPFWDGNETWLVLGGGGLLAAFPLAYSIFLPAVYLPLIAMLLGLVLRGVAFEFRFKAGERDRKIWDYSFHLGSLTASFFQGVILGAYVQGIAVKNNAYAGAAMDWLTPFALCCGLAVVAGYALLGATWLVMKTEDRTQAWARRTARYLLLPILFFMALVSLWVPFLSEAIATRWFSTPNIFYLSPVPLTVAAAMLTLWKALNDEKAELKPFLLTMSLFALGYLGLAISVWPHVLPPGLTLEQAAARPESLSLLLLGVAPILPIILAYTAYSYRVFRGKSSHEALY